MFEYSTVIRVEIMVNKLLLKAVLVRTCSQRVVEISQDAPARYLVGPRVSVRWRRNGEFSQNRSTLANLRNTVRMASLPAWPVKGIGMYYRFRVTVHKQSARAYRP